MAATPLNASTLKTVTNEATERLVKALDRNTAALLTVATEIMRGSRASVSQDDAHDEVLQLFNRFVGP
jgi:hypothetical protein